MSRAGLQRHIIEAAAVLWLSFPPSASWEGLVVFLKEKYTPPRGPPCSAHKPFHTGENVCVPPAHLGKGSLCPHLH